MMNKKEWIKPEIYKMPIEEFIHAFNKDDLTGESCILAKDLDTMREILGVNQDYKLDIYE